MMWDILYMVMVVITTPFALMLLDSRDDIGLEFAFVFSIILGILWPITLPTMIGFAAHNYRQAVRLERAIDREYNRIHGTGAEREDRE